MARTDTGRWVARAAATGGGRTYRGRRPVRWYTALVLIVVVGVALVVYSRYERQHPSAGTQPTIGAHWYASLAFDICGTVEPNLPANPNEASAAPGLHTAGDGVIQINPAKAADAGNNATLGRFVRLYPGLALSPTSVRLPGKATHHSGQICPAGTPDAGKKADVTVKVWPSFTSSSPSVPSDPTTLKLANGQLITVAFLPPSSAVPKPPPSVVQTMLTDISGTSSSTTTTTPSSPTTTTTPSSPTTTTTPTSPTTTSPSTTTSTPTSTTTTTTKP
jgi:hypothetical protein